MNRIRGTNVLLGGKTYLLPPANFNTLDKHDEFLQRYMDNTREPGTLKIKSSDMHEMAEIVHEALKRNYPDLPFEEFAQHVDFGNITELFQAAMKASGFQETTAGE